jgi:hypothetical protein
MIDWNKTFKETGYNKNYFDKYPKSARKIYKLCDNYKICGDKGKWISNQNKSTLCGSCSHIGKKRKPFTNEHKANMSKNHAHLLGKDAPNWQGGLVTLTCKQCGEEYKNKRSLQNISKFCSKQCVSKWQSINQQGENCPAWKDKIILRCQYCNEKYEVIPSQKDSKFCSIKCKDKQHSKNMSGENNPSYGKHHTLEHRKRMSCSKQGINREDFTEFIGRSPNRKHVLLEKDCIKLNKKFSGSVFHHIFKSVGVYIPSYLHRSIHHNLKNGYKIKEINKLAFNYLLGDYNGNSY